jgi:signal transduction histidine kinase
VAEQFRETPPLYTSQFHWAVKKGRVELRDFINQGYGRISSEELDEIEARWLGNPLRFPVNPRYLTYAAIALATIMLAAGLLIGWNRSLRLRVTARTAELRAAMEATQRDVERIQNAEGEVRRLNAELEGRIAERTAQLTAANRELEAFGYSLSHDMRGPVRAVGSFTQLLLERQGDKLDEKSLSYLARLRAWAYWSTTC